MNKSEIFKNNIELLSELDSYILENYEETKVRFSSVINPSEKRFGLVQANKCEEVYDYCINESLPVISNNLEEEILKLDKSFSEKLIMLIDAKGFKDSEVYQKAQISRQLFNSIKNEKGYRPKKNTVLSLLLALNLSLAECEEMLKVSGYSFSNSEKSDIIIKYCFENEIYDVDKVNDLLYFYDQQLLGSK